jgi:hypothetical protein
MELHFWLIPSLVILTVLVVAFYIAVRMTGGSGVRSNGRTLVDKPVEEKPPASSQWNFIEPVRCDVPPPH